MPSPEPLLPEEMEFVYVGDPMCSWCWGFAPVLQQLEGHYTIPVRTVVGGLRPGPAAEPLTERYRATLAHHWDQVAAATGQPFDHSALDRDGWVYDTELPARAVVTMRRLVPADTLTFFERLQRAFYAEAIDITDPSAYAALLVRFPVDVDPFVDAMTADAAKREAWNDFAEARRVGVTGFPHLLLRLDEELLTVTRGYAPWDRLEPALTAWLSGRYGAPATAPLLSDVDGAG